MILIEWVPSHILRQSISQDNSNNVILCKTMTIPHS